MTDPNVLSHWRRSKKLMLAAMAAWAALSIGVPLLLVPLNLLSVPYLDLPVGFLLSTQGAPLAFLLVTSVFARRQDHIDRDHFVAGG